MITSIIAIVTAALGTTSIILIVTRIVKWVSIGALITKLCSSLIKMAINIKNSILSLKSANQLPK